MQVASGPQSRAEAEGLPGPPLSTRAQRRQKQEAQASAKALRGTSASACTLLLARHGETEWNAAHRLQGQEDPPLNARGMLQAAALAAALQGEPLARIYTSDLRRALHTAQAVASALGHCQDAVVALPSLRERHLGVLQGLTRREAAAKEPEAYAALVSTDAAAAPPGGESLSQLRSRCTAEVERLAAAHPGATLLLVAHGGVLQCLFERAAGRRPPGGGVPNGALGRIRVEGTRWALLDWGQTVDPAARGSGGEWGGG